jgi:DNA polymerase III subunit epsilon
MNYIALDIETAIGKRWSICQIGLVVVRNSMIVDEISYLVQPPNNEYSIYNTRVHGITKIDTLNSPRFNVIWDKIKNLLINELIVCHNTDFDINCLNQTLEYYNLEKQDFNYKCTYKMSGKSLSFLCNHFDIELLNHHDALSDARACALIYQKLISRDENSFDSLITHNNTSYKKLSDRIKGDVLKPDFENGDINSPFYKKKIVFTGVLSTMERKQAAEIAKKLGADIDHGITKRTNFVIVGSAPGPVKMKKINRFNENGSNIIILSEQEFINKIS